MSAKQGDPYIRDKGRIGRVAPAVNSPPPQVGAARETGILLASRPPYPAYLHCIIGTRRNTMQILGLCRFSYPALGGFQVGHETIEDRIAYLYEPARLEERFRLFEAVALPCLMAQTDPDFEMIVLVGDSLPKQHMARLKALLSPLPHARIIVEPPRPHREVMKEILNKARLSRYEPCVQFRFDDDDAIAVDFIAKLRKAVDDAAPLLVQHKSVALDWNKGYVAEFGADGIEATPSYRPFYTAALAMFVNARCPLTIMNFAHDKLPRFMPALSFPDQAMYVRGHNGFNDSRQKNARPIELSPLSAEEETLFKDRFAIDINAVRRVFAKG